MLLADDHAMVREGMAEMLSLNDDVEVVAQAGNGREAVALAKETVPDVVILDVEMPVMGAQAALGKLLKFPSPPKVTAVWCASSWGSERARFSRRAPRRKTWFPPCAPWFRCFHRALRGSGAARG